MDAQRLLSACEGAGIDFFTGVPDSQLKGLCDSLYALYGVHSPRHIVAANEGNAVGPPGISSRRGVPRCAICRIPGWATPSIRLRR